MGKKIIVVLFILLVSITIAFILQLNFTLGSISKNLGYTSANLERPKYRLAFIYQNNNNGAFWEKIKQGASQAALSEKVFINFMEVIRGQELSVTDYLRLAIEAEYDGIIIRGDDKRIVPLVQEAVNAGIPSLMIAADLPGSGRIGYVGTNNYRAGYKAGKVMMEKSKSDSPPLVAVLSPLTGSNLPMSVSESLKVFGFREAISSRKTVVPIWEKANPTLIDSIVAVQNLLQRYPKLEGIYATYSEGALAASRVILERKAAGKITIIGQGDIPILREYIRSGAISATIVEYPYQMGYTAVKEMTRYLHQGSVNISKSIDMVVLDRDNLDLYSKRGY